MFVYVYIQISEVYSRDNHLETVVRDRWKNSEELQKIVIARSYVFIYLFC